LGWIADAKLMSMMIAGVCTVRLLPFFELETSSVFVPFQSLLDGSFVDIQVF
jgi:hypothetical protein